LKLMPDRSIPVAVLPLGTANNIASSLGITGEPEEIAQAWRPGRERLISIGRCTAPWGEMPFIEAVGFGAMVDATESGLAGEKEGKSRLLMGRDAFRKAVKKAKARDLEVTIHGKEIKGDLIALEILNVGYAEPGIPLCLTAKPGDNFLDVVAIRESQREAMLDWISATEETNKPPGTVTRGKKVVIRWKGKPGMRVDDEHVDAQKREATIIVELEKKPVTVLVPPRKAAPRKADGRHARRSHRPGHRAHSRRTGAACRRRDRHPHALHGGVYHAREGSGLHFDGQPVAVTANPAVRRRLAGLPTVEAYLGAWDVRKTGSAAIECALVASGSLTVARFAHVNWWDIAGGVALVLAAGGVVH
jgi:diacylglycerol kinase (ATP)